MYIQFTADGMSYSSEDFEDQKTFLKSLAIDTVFRVYVKDHPKSQDKISIKKVLKSMKIKSVSSCMEKKSKYLEFTAVDAKNEKMQCCGIIAWE